ncbi:MAG: multidrug ABC transporter ATP-binding protein [Candidatus Aminicenantes bacterium RBG_16_63_16]|nr:MAG: multidrug ABC transporter ATP-binding protein [Candidatus Aminicenantes bacterium RBG_16_63_16]
MATVLNIEDLHKTFISGFIPKKRRILKGISFSVTAGEIFGFLGPNGAGKTTTLKCALGLIFPDRGKIEIFGRHHLDARAKRRVGYLPEHPYFYEYLTATEFLDFYGQLFLMDRVERKEKTAALLRQVGLERAVDLPLRKFSRGMLQRVGLAQALINDPALVLLDEPLGGLDPLGRKELRDIIARLKQDGKTVFLCSHILQDIEMICDRVAIVAGGRVVSQGALLDLISEKVLYTEVTLSGLAEEDLIDLGEPVSIRSDRILIKVFQDANVDALLELVRERRGRVHSLVPRTETLEDIFVEMVKQS